VRPISKEALRRISSEVRCWRLHHRTSLTEAELARVINPIDLPRLAYVRETSMRELS
jgi:hypothetical protein